MVQFILLPLAIAVCESVAVHVPDAQEAAACRGHPTVQPFQRYVAVTESESLSEYKPVQVKSWLGFGDVGVIMTLENAGA
jgi:hypothetical protein